MSTTPEILDAEVVHVRSGMARQTAWLFLIGGIGAFFFAAIGMGIAIVGNVSQIGLHAMTTMPVLLGLGAVAAGWSLLRAPQQVIVSGKGVTIASERMKSFYGWDQIGWAKTDTTIMGTRKVLLLYDPRGKRLAQISDAFEDFDGLARSIIARVSEGEAAKTVSKKKSRQTALICGITGGVLMAAAIGLSWDAYNKQRGEALLASEGVEGEGTIVRRFLAPNGVTPRLEYKVNEESGVRNAEVERGYWDSLEDATTAPVIYVPSQPWHSRLVIGEVTKNDFTDTPAGTLMIGGLGGLLSLFLLGVGAMAWLGWDIALDDKTGKIALKRI